MATLVPGSLVGLLALGGALAFGQTASSDSPNLTVTTLNVAANSLAWDPRSQQIYLTAPGSGGAGNSIEALNPLTGSIATSVPVTGVPDLLAVSMSSEYLYVGFDSGASVQRFTLPALSPDIQIALGSDPIYGSYYAFDIQPSPTADGTVAVVRGAANDRNEPAGGAAIYDNATQRAAALCGPGQSECSGITMSDYLRSIQWRADAAEMFAAGNSLYVIPVSATGFGQATDLYDVATDIGPSIHVDRSTGLVDTDSGNVVDMDAGTLVGTFGGGAGVYDSIAMIPDAALAKAFFISGAEFTGNTYTLQSFDLRTRQLIDTVTVQNVVGVPSHFIRWGTNGLAFTTTSTSYSPGSAVYILSGSFVSPSAEPPWPYANAVNPIDSHFPIIQPGEWVSIYGSDLAPQTATWTGNFPKSLGGVSVTIDGYFAYLWYVSPGQINLQVPDIPNNDLGTRTVVITTPSGSTEDQVVLEKQAPSLLLLDNTHICAIILRPDGSGAYGGGTYDILGPPGNSLGYPTVAAKAGDTVEIFAVGLGPTTPVVASGQAFSGAAPTSFPVTVTINRQNVSPGFAGLSSAGLYQINLSIPAGLGVGDVPIFLTASGSRTSVNTVISLQ